MKKMNFFNKDEISKTLVVKLQEEFSRQDKSGIYGFTQYTMAYNSNKIEGSRLSEFQTVHLFNTLNISSEGEVFTSKDVEEATGHFLMLNHVLKTLDEDLSEDLICRMHYELKAGVFEDRANGYAIGQYKKMPNAVYNIVTSLPERVPDDMKSLLEWYVSEKITLKRIAQFHYKFEKIHPFQDGNGRVGRMIIFRECLRNGIIPVIIKDSSKQSYISALNFAQSNNDSSNLVKLFNDEQIWYEEKIKYFLGIE